MSIARFSEKWASRRGGALSRLVGIWVLLTLLLAGAAHATPELVLFDEPSGFGFEDPGDQDLLPIDKTIGAWSLAGDAEFSPRPGEDDQFLLIIEPANPPMVRCGERGDVCSSTSHPVEVIWNVRLNEFHPLVMGNSGAIDVNLFLVDSDRGSAYRLHTVGIYYESAVVDGIGADFETAMFSTSTKDYFFLSLALDDMLPGEDGIREIRFRYQDDGRLPADGATFIVPHILSASFMTIPEPGTGLMLGLGLIGMALKGRREYQ